MDGRSDKELAEALAAVPLFSQCSQRELRSIAKEGKTLKKKAGSSIVREGRTGHAFFLMLSGAVDIYRDDQPLARLRPGDFFGEMALLTDHQRNATAQAAENTELFTLTEWSFKALMLTNPKLAYKVLRTVAARANAM